MILRAPDHVDEEIVVEGYRISRLVSSNKFGDMMRAPELTLDLGRSRRGVSLPTRHELRCQIARRGVDGRVREEVERAVWMEHVGEWEPGEELGGKARQSAPGGVLP